MRLHEKPSPGVAPPPLSSSPAPPSEALASILSAPRPPAHRKPLSLESSPLERCRQDSGLTACSILGIVGWGPSLSALPGLAISPFPDPESGVDPGGGMCPSWQAPCGAAKPSRLGPDPGILASPPPLRPSLSPPLRIIFSTPLAIIAYFLIWFVPDFKQGQALWYLLFYCLFETLVTVSVGTSPGCLGGLWGGAVPGASGLVPEATFVCPSSDWPRASLPCQCFHVPYSALTMFISTEQSERDSATAYRMTVEVLGTVLGTAIQGQIVGQADTPCIQDVNASTVASEGVNLTQSATSLKETQNAYLLAAGVIASIYVICAIILILGVREQREPYETQQTKPMSFFPGLRLVMSHGPYIKLIAGFLFTSLAFMLVEGNFALFCTYTLGFRNEFQNLLLAIMLSATITIPIWQWFLTRFGKKMAVYIGISSAVPFLILVALMESNLIVTYVVAVAAGISVAAAFLLPWSMLPDVIDDFHLKQPHIHGTEPIFFSFYVFFTKFASGVSLGISTLSLE
uniref:MFSD2 lysolipid transporter A, lysophospholipid n=1 Tax=Sus scrofa TaxID=9823 RepID=A0A8D1PZP4_PIG